MFELKNLPSYETLVEFAAIYHNPDIEGLQTWLVWAATTSEMLGEFEACLRLHGLSQSQFFVLLLLKRKPDGLSIGALAEGVAVTSQTMTRLIDRMEAQALCRKQSDPDDRRVWIVVLTQDGERLLAQALPSHYAWVARLMANFNPQERRLLQDMMLKLRQPGSLA